MSESEISYPMDQQSEMPRLSNGARAARIAAEHFTELEQVNEKLRLTIVEHVSTITEQQGRLMEQAELIERVMQDRDQWMHKAIRSAETVMNVMTLMVEAGKDAREVINRTRPTEAER